MSKPTGPIVLDLETVLARKATLRKRDEARPVSATVAPTPPVRRESLQPKVNPNKGRALPACPVKAAAQEIPPPVPPRDDLVATGVVAQQDTPPAVPAREEVALTPPPVPPMPPAPPAPPKMPAPAAAANATGRPALLFSGNDLAARANQLKKTETRVAPVVTAKVTDATQPKVNAQNAVVNAPIAAATAAAKPKGMGMMGGMDELQAKIAASAARRSVKIQ